MQCEGLSDEFTVVAWDEPGCGQSSDVPPNFTLSDYADSLAAVIDSLALGPAHVVGLSWGGTVVLELYRRRPDAVAKLIFVGAFAGWKGSMSDDDLRDRVEAAQALLADPSDFDPRLPGLFAGEPSAEVGALLDEMASGYRAAAFAREAMVMAEADQRDIFQLIEVPTLLIWGELDARSPLTIARQFDRAIRDAELVVMPAAGHLCQLERPTSFNHVVRTFCKAQRQTPDIDDH